MKYNPDKHHRKTLRLPGYDYSHPGAYFVTICTQYRRCLFGAVENGQMALNDAGEMIQKWIGELESKFPDIKCDPFVIMPNHVHFVIHNVGADLCICPNNNGEHTGSPLPRVVQWFKTMTTNEYIRGVKQNQLPVFPGKLWQRNYYEHIIRDDHELNRIREYIINNPMRWEMDQNHPDNIKS